MHSSTDSPAHTIASEIRSPHEACQSRSGLLTNWIVLTSTIASSSLLHPKAIGGTAVTNTNVDPGDDIQLGSNGNKLIRLMDKDRGVHTLYDKVIRIVVGMRFDFVSFANGESIHKICPCRGDKWYFIVYKTSIYC